jgi:AraC family transcriptional regulator
MFHSTRLLLTLLRSLNITLRIKMLRSFERICQPADMDLLIAADEGHAVLTGSGAYAMPWHWHDCFMLLLPNRGTLELKHEGRREGTWLSPDRFAILPPDRAHATQAGVGAHSHVAIYVTSAALCRLDNEIGSLSEFHRRTRPTALVRRTSTVRMLQELLLQRGGGAYGSSAIRRALSSALLLQCIAEVVSGEAVPSSSHREHGMALVEDLKAYLILHTDQNIPLDTLGERFGVSRRHITRLFRSRTGFSIGEFQQWTRLQTARELLSGTDLPIGEIAFRVGFESGAALARAMRRAGGDSPSDIRKRVAHSVKT